MLGERLGGPPPAVLVGLLKLPKRGGGHAFPFYFIIDLFVCLLAFPFFNVGVFGGGQLCGVEQASAVT